MHGNPSNPHSCFRPAFPVHRYGLDPVQNLLTSQKAPENRILAIQMRGWRKEDEELAAVGHGAFVRHADDTAGVVAKGGADLIFERGVPDGGACFCGGGGGRAGLEHESRDEAVDRGAIVGGGCAEGEEVLDVVVRDVRFSVRAADGTSAVLGTLSQKTSILR